MNIESNIKSENLQVEPTIGIERLLPRYYETHGENHIYEIEDSIIIDGHQVSWMRYSGKISHDLLGLGREGQPYSGHSLHCECYFEENVGWKMTEENKVTGLSGKDTCDKLAEATKLRYLNLLQEYIDKGFMSSSFEENNYENVKTVMLDLIEKDKAEEFLEASNGAHFYGGHYYLQTVNEITGIPFTEIWQAVSDLQEQNKIRLNGMVVQEYREPEKIEQYNSETMPEVIYYQEKDDKVWALIPRPEYRDKINPININNKNQRTMLGSCIVGLANNKELAMSRLIESIENPRPSRDRLYQQSFIETGYHAGALAVVAYTARHSQQPEEWVIEGFIGNAIVPEVRKLKMYHDTTFGIDSEDLARLEEMIDEWFPSK